MHPQLEAIVEEFNSAQQRLHTLVAKTSEQSWTRRPDPARWSAAECVAHLNLTSNAYISILKEAIARGHQSSEPAPKRYRHDLIGWFLFKTMGPPVRFRIKTTAPFVPKSGGMRSELVAEFDRLQAEQIECVKECEGLPMHLIRVTSPFEARLKYNFYSSLAMLPRHEHRHLWQAEQTLSKGAPAGVRPHH